MTRGNFLVSAKSPEIRRDGLKGLGFFERARSFLEKCRTFVLLVHLKNRLGARVLTLSGEGPDAYEEPEDPLKPNPPTPLVRSQQLLASSSATHNQQRGSVWLWLVLIVLIAGGLAGALFYRDQTQLKKGQGAVQAADAALQSKNYQEAADKAKEGLAALTAVGPWTPLNAEALKSEKQAVKQLWLAEFHLSLKDQPLKAERLLRKMERSGQDFGLDDALKANLRGRLTARTIRQLEKNGYLDLEALWKSLDARGNLPADLVASRKAGALRSKARDFVDSVCQKLQQQQWDELRSIMASDNLLQSYEPAFKGQAQALAQLRARSERARAIFEKWDELDKTRQRLDAWAEQVMQEKQGLGQFYKESNLKIVKFDQLAAAERDKEFGFEAVVKSFQSSKTELEARHKDLLDLAALFKDMVLVQKSSGKVADLVFMDRYEVTQGQFEEFIKAGGYDKGKAEQWWLGKDALKQLRRYGKPKYWNDRKSYDEFRKQRDDPSFPVTGVSFYGAQAYARFRKKRLPSVEEWWAAYGRSRFPWGEDLRADAVSVKIAGKGRLWKRGDRAQGGNRAGVEDLLGNAYEWASEGKKVRLLGGSYKTSLADVKKILADIENGKKEKADLRDFLTFASALPKLRRDDLGFRLVRTLKWNRSKKRWVKD